MSQQEKFLERWSRRKRQSGEDSAREAKQDPASGGRDAESSELPAPGAPSAAAAEPAFDPASLPPLESIVANSDIRAFLRPGVPAGLTRAALRRAWSADPAIRDFIGLSENSWDFTAPNGVPGFGPLDPTEVPRLLAEVFGPETREKVQSVLEAVERTATPQGKLVDSAGKSEGPVTPTADLPVESVAGALAQGDTQNLPPSKDDDVAVQDSSREPSQRLAQSRRSHGGALPE